MKMHLVTIVAITCLMLSCRKDELKEITTAPGVKITPPAVDAGLNTTIVLPEDSVVLYGSAVADPARRMARYQWKKISGPDSYLLQTPESIVTKVLHLEKGRYEFELTATDNGGLSGKDTVAISVLEVSAGINEVVFPAMPWVCPMGCTITIRNFYSYVPPWALIKVFVSSDGDWIEAKHVSEWQQGVKYVYGIANENLTVYTDEAPGVSFIKIVF